jgi:hypothetical protein
MPTDQIKLPMEKVFNTIGPIVLLTVVWVVLIIHILNTRKKLPSTTIVIDRGSYHLILGQDAKQIFLHYRVTKMHGLSLSGAEQRIAEGGSYIDGLCNYHPRDKNLVKNPLPFVFLNIGSLQNNYSNHEVYTCIMHECMHMAGLIYNGCWDSHEEEMITWAEKEANEIIVLLKKKKFI